MYFQRSRGCSRRFRLIIATALYFTCRASLAAGDQPPAGALLPTNDAVIARVFEHNGDAPRPLVLVVDRTNFSDDVWNRVKNLVAFRLHRHRPDGSMLVDAPIYVVRNSAIHVKAAKAMRAGTTNDAYVWCLLAAVLAHEAAHITPLTERQALIAEAEQLQHCLHAGHLYTSNGWSAGAYLQQVEAKLRQPREHY
jgi:hypothetical protein